MLTLLSRGTLDIKKIMSLYHFYENHLLKGFQNLLLFKLFIGLLHY
jgi:hypothetical protein